MNKIKFTKGDRVRAKFPLNKTSGWVEDPNDYVYGGGRWDYFDVPVGAEGVFVRSSSDSGPAYKVVKWDFNGRESEVHKTNIEMVPDEPLT